MTRAQPSTITKSSSLKGSDTITGGIIIMPSAISAPLTTRSMTRNGMKMMKPMMKACLSSVSTNAGISVVSRDVLPVRRAARGRRRW